MKLALWVMIDAVHGVFVIISGLAQ